jgi:protein-disulfide isomerase
MPLTTSPVVRLLVTIAPGSAAVRLTLRRVSAARRTLRRATAARRMLRRVTALLALLLIGVPAGAAAQQESPQARLLKRAAESRAKGAQNAPVLVYEIADFQCPYCGRFALEVFPQIDSAYVRTGRVQWVFVNLPMPSHGNAWLAAEAALCAGATADRFWALHDRLFATQQEWSGVADPAALFLGYARDAGVPADAFLSCVAGDRVAALILQDVIFGSRVSGTPTFVINNQQTVVGMKSFGEWQEILEAALRKR